MSELVQFKQYKGFLMRVGIENNLVFRGPPNHGLKTALIAIGVPYRGRGSHAKFLNDLGHVLVLVV